MNAIMIALAPTQDGQPLTEQAGAVPGLDIWQWRIDQNNGKAALREASNRQQPTPPLWTWFIENPRPVRQHSAMA